MPATITEKQAADAYNLLYREVHAPVLFTKLASDFGIQPRSAEEAEELCVLGGKLRTLYALEQEKAAGAAGSLLKRANAHVDNLLAAAEGRPAPAQPVTQAVKQAAAKMSSRPEIASAVLTLQAAVAQHASTAA